MQILARLDSRMTPSDSLRAAIEHSGYTRSKISNGVGVSQPGLSRFMRGGGISLKTAEKLFVFFGFSIVPPVGEKATLEAQLPPN